MSNDDALNSGTPSFDHPPDEDDLKALKLQDSDLDRFATYFDLVFQGNSQSVTVLVALLRRLCSVETLRQQKQTDIWIEDVVARFTHRLHATCEPGFEAASRFGMEASESAEHIFSEALAGHKRVAGFVVDPRSI